MKSALSRVRCLGFDTSGVYDPPFPSVGVRPRIDLAVVEAIREVRTKAVEVVKYMLRVPNGETACGGYS